MRIFLDGDTELLALELKKLGADFSDAPENAELIYRVGAFRNAGRTFGVLTAEGGGTRAWPFRLAEEIMRSRVIRLGTDAFLRLDRKRGESPAVISDMLFVGSDGTDPETIAADTARVIASFSLKSGDF